MTGRIFFHADSDQSSIRQGKSLDYTLTMYPEDATANVLKEPVEVAVRETELAFLEKNADVSSTVTKIIDEDIAEGVLVSGMRLYASELAVPGTEVEVAAFVNGIQSNVLKFRVVAAEETEPTTLDTAERNLQTCFPFQKERDKKLKNFKKVKKTLDIIFPKCYYV